MNDSEKSAKPQRIASDIETKDDQAGRSLSVDPELVEQSREPDLESRMEAADTEQFNVRYLPARKFLMQNYVLNQKNSKSTAKNYDHSLNRYVDYLAEKTGKPIDEAERDDIVGFFYFLGTEYRRSQSTLKKYKAIIKNLHEFLQIHDSLPEPEISAARIGNVDVGKFALQESTFEREDIARWEVKALIEAADGARNTLLILVLYETGIRNDDAAKLKLQDIHFDSDRISIQDSKGGNSYQVPIRPELTLKLHNFTRVSRDPANEDCEYLFPSNKGGHLSNTQITRIVRETAWQAEEDIQRVIATIKSTPNQTGKKGNERKIHRVTPHTLRHSLVTHLSDDNVPKELQKVITGHESDAIEIYDHSEDTTAFDLAREEIPH